MHHPTVIRLFRGAYLLPWAFGIALYAQEVPRDDPLLERARSANAQEALALYRQLTEKYPNSITAWYGLGEAQYAADRLEDALEAYRRCEELGDEPKVIGVRIAKTLAKLKRYPEAQRRYEAVLALDPDNISARFGAGAARYSQGHSAEALPAFEALARREDEWGVYAQEFLALCLYDTGKYERAILILSRLLEKDPKQTEIRWSLAKSLYKARRFAEALPHLRQVAAEDPGKQEAARFYEAVALEGLGRRREAERLYEELGAGDSVWAAEGRKAHRGLVGKPWRIFLDYLGGYDTGVVQAGEDSVFLGGKDYFQQVFALFSGRVFRSEGLNIWLDGEHFGLHYQEIVENDYFQDRAGVNFELPRVGFLDEVHVKYSLMYAQLDYQPYQKQHRIEAGGSWTRGPNRVRFTIEYGDNKYYRESEGLIGPDLRFTFDWRRTLPLWDHELRLRGNVDQRWTQADTSKRLSQRVRLQYRAQIWDKLYGQLEGAWRVDDYPDSQGPLRRHRTDHRLRGEARIDYQIWKHAWINWGYSYESQDSRREDQEYGRHQVDAGVTFSF